MIAFVAAIGIGLIAVILQDAFETVVLPRRVPRNFRLGRFYYIMTWGPWRAIAHRLRGKRREYFLSIYGPLSVFGLLVVWACGLVLGFGLIDLAISWAWPAADGAHGLWMNLYLSGTTFFTLGPGDVVAHNTLGRAVMVLESGTGFGFLAVVIGYLPVIYGAFSRREVSIVLLDARAGSPPTACELLRRHAGSRGMDALELLFHEWERWSADLLESHISYPVVAFFRSQHDNQSWVAALTAILDSTTIVIAGVEGACARQAKLTFAMARHAVVD
ncbi:MAG: potassium channel family protein, partial [Candidatus Acidiferrales bacterium]